MVIRANVGNATDMQNLVLNNLAPVGVAHPANTGIAFPPATLTILSLTLPDGVVGTPFSTQVNIFGGVGAHTASISNGSLPAGLTLDPATGIISGTPLTSGSFSFTVQVTDSSTAPATTSQALTIRIGAPLVISNASLFDGVVGIAYSETLNSTGGLGNTTWSIASGALPLGINISSAGVLSGTPTILNTAGTPVTIQVQDSALPLQTTTISGNIHIAPVLTIATPTGPLPDAVVGLAYNFTFKSNGGLTPITWSVKSGSLPSGLTLSPSGTLTGTPTTGGSFSFTIQASDGSSPAQTITINVSVRSATLLAIATAGGALPDAVLGSNYTPITLQFIGGTAPQVWSVGAGQLPPGMGLSGSGFISGLPGATGTYSFTARLQDSASPAQVASVTLSIRVAAPLVITTPSGALPGALFGAPYNQTLTSTGGNAPIIWTVIAGQVPPGMALSLAGVLSGPPTSTGSTGQFSFTVKAVDSSSPQQSANASFSISVASNLSISFSTQPSNTSSAASQITPSVKVTVVDNLGNALRGATVQVSLATNPTGALLTGNTVGVTGNNGVAVFSNLGINQAGNGYTLKATVTSPQYGAVAISVPFNVL